MKLQKIPETQTLTARRRREHQQCELSIAAYVIAF
jgi:hypothetical protein